MKRRFGYILLLAALIFSLLPVVGYADVALYKPAEAPEEGEEYLLTVEQKTTARAGTLYTFTKNGSVSGSYSVKGQKGYLYATSSKLYFNGSSVDGKSSWNVTLSGGSLTLRNNTSSKYYLLYGGSGFSVSKTSGASLTLYGADGAALTSLPEGTFQAYICNADGIKALNDSSTGEDARQVTTANYALTDSFSVLPVEFRGDGINNAGEAAVWQYRDGMLRNENASGPVCFADGKLLLGEGYLTFSEGTPGIGSEAEAASVRLWKKTVVQPEAGSYLAITSDIHYKYKKDFTTGDTESTERLQGWLEQVSRDLGGVVFDQFISCGDMGDANTSITGSNYWERVQVVMDTVDDCDLIAGDGFYVNGNHEWQNGKYSDYKDKSEAAKRIRPVGSVEETDAYVIYSFTASKTNNNFDTADIDALENYLKTAPTGKPIFIVSHYPLHNYSYRVVQRKDDVIGVLNRYSDRLQIVYLWGHNHTEEDTHYGTVYTEEIDGTPIRFTYASAGCMTDLEYDVHAENTVAKGMIAYISPEGEVQMTYYNREYQILSETTLAMAADCENPGHAAFTVRGGAYSAGTASPTAITDVEVWLRTPQSEGGGYIPALGHTDGDGDEKCDLCGRRMPDLRYDADGNGIISIADVTTLLFRIQSGEDCKVDPNGDGLISILDVTTLLGYLAG